MLYLLTLQAVALAQEVAPVVASHPDMWGVGGGGIAGLLSAVLALLVKDKLLSPTYSRQYDRGVHTNHMVQM